MSIIQVNDLSFTYEGSYDPVFSNVSLQLDSNWKLGLIGRNGRGKTTFLQLLMGNYSYTGSITKGINFQYFPISQGNDQEITLDVMSEICPEAEDWEFIKELSLLDLDASILYRVFSTLSEGEQKKALLAAQFLVSNTFLLIDEPTNHLDEASRETLEKYLKQKNGFILVSHDRKLIDSCVDHILSINKTDIELQRGNFSSWWENTQRKNQDEQEEYEKLDKERKRLDVASKKNAKWSDETEGSKYGGRNAGSKIDRGYVGHKAAKMMKRAKTIEARKTKALDTTKTLLKNREVAEQLQMRPLLYRTERLLSLSDISISYENHLVMKNFQMELQRGERIALKGKNGSGKSSILKLLCGEEIHYSGHLQMGSGLIISYLTQDTSWLQGTLEDFAKQYQLDKSIFQALLYKLGISRIQFEKKMEDFSEGQKKKVLLAKSLCESAHLYIWDEPLNYIDVYSKMQIEELLLAFQPTMLFVEHDAMFCDKIATGTIQLI